MENNNLYKSNSLSSFNENVVSLRDYTPESIAKVLEEICDGYGTIHNELMLNENYMNAGQFSQTVKSVEEVLNETLSDC